MAVVSFVEKALKKLQDAQQRGSSTGSPARPGYVVGEVVEVEIPDDAPLAKAGRADVGVDSKGVDFAAPPVRRSEKRIKIDRAAVRTAGLLPPAQQERRLANEYRAIKRPLISAALGRGVEKLPNGHLIMVASALPGEGKSFTSMNLALSMALEKDVTVLLVDADLAKPHISTTFGVRNELGLLDALFNPDLDVESLVIPTDIPNLSILPAGTAMETATELLASERMDDIVKRLGAVDSRRIVLFDSPPLLLTSESRALATVVGQTVVVVRAGSTQRAAVKEALSYLPADRPLGLILNQSEVQARGEYYGYGEYGAATGTDEKNAKDKS